MPQYLYRIEPTRPGMPDAPTEEEGRLVGAHFAYLQAAWTAGTVAFVGRTETAPHLGLALLEAADDAAAQRFLEGDPAVAAGAFRGLVQPFRTVLAFRS